MISNSKSIYLFLLLFVFLCFIVSCEQKNIEKKDRTNFSDQINTPQETSKENIEILYLLVVYANNNEELVSTIEKIKSLGDDAVPWLKKEMLSGKEDSDWAARILTEIGTENAAEALLIGAKESEFPSERNITKLAAITGLGKLKYKEAIPFLIENIKGDYNAVSRYSAKALAEIDPDTARKEIETRLKAQDADWRTHTIHARRDFIETLGNIGTSESLKSIEITFENAKKVKNPSKSQTEALNALYKAIDETKKKINERG